MNLKDEIKKLKKEKNALILAHNYQLPEVQEIADFVGDSLELARTAQKSQAKIIVLCGVRFMAESAKILSPEKKVLLPRKEAGCPMADMVNASQLREFKEKHPGAVVVSYVNTSAEVKAESDLCCTSSNALKILTRLEAEKIIFVPDQNLASYCQRFVKKQIIPWDGYCYVHTRFSAQEVKKAKEKIPEAVLIVHPECTPEVIDLADYVLSTGQMVKFCREAREKKFLIGTEEGLIYRLKKENPDKKFFSAGTAKVCANMKLTRLQDVYLSLLEEKHPIELPSEVIFRAKKALEQMARYV